MDNLPPGYDGYSDDPVYEEIYLTRRDLDKAIVQRENMRHQLSESAGRNIDLINKITKVRGLHNSDGYRYFGRLPGNPKPNPEGESYCTHCNQAYPCQTVQILGVK